MECKKCGNKLSLVDKFCPQCGESNSVMKQNEAQNTTKKVNGSPILLGAIILLVVAVFGYFIESGGNNIDNQEATNVFNDVINQTNTSTPASAEYKKVLADYLDYIANQGAIVIALDKELLASDFLETTSYATVSGMQEIIDMMTRYKNAVATYNTNFPAIIQGANGVINKSSLSASDKREMIEGVETSFKDTRRTELRNTRTTALIDYANSVISLYEFLIISHDSYELGNDELGEYSILFYTDYELNRFNQLIGEVNSAQSYFQQIDAALREYTQRSLKESGLDVDVDDAIDYFYR